MSGPGVRTCTCKSNFLGDGHTCRGTVGKVRHDTTWPWSRPGSTWRLLTCDSVQEILTRKLRGFYLGLMVSDYRSVAPCSWKLTNDVYSSFRWWMFLWKVAARSPSFHRATTPSRWTEWVPAWWPDVFTTRHLFWSSLIIPLLFIKYTYFIKHIIQKPWICNKKMTWNKHIFIHLDEIPEFGEK